jgi:DNA-binding NtrC family response regulator
MSDSGRVLLVGAPPRVNAGLAPALARRGLEVHLATTLNEALAAVDASEFDVLAVEFQLADGTAIELSERVRELQRDLPVLVLTESPSLDTAVATLRAGAWDYHVWPMPVEALAMALKRGVQHRRLRREVRRLRRQLQRRERYGELLGDSPAMQEVFDTLDRIGRSRAPVLVTGETGTGKELVARAVHEASSRSDGPFVAINCGAIPEGLLESELFGHVKGAFTDARSARTGLFVQASGGTIFLDEIGELPRSVQVKLLRALQERKVRPVGSDREVAFDARIVAATNLDLDAQVEDGAFRRDLYYRLNVIRIELPPLRMRGSDALTLAQHFLERAVAEDGAEIDGFSDAVGRKLLEYDWPGNVRELENCVEHAVAFASGPEITTADLPARLRDHKASHVLVTASHPDDLVPLRVMEARYLRRVLTVVHGNKSAAARILGLERKSLYRKMKRFGLDGSEGTGTD